MEEAPINKMQKKETTKDNTPDIVEIEYTFPDYGLVIKAKSLAEAEEKLQAILQKQTKQE